MRKIVWPAVAALMVGCGGGGSGSPNTPAPAPQSFNADRAVTNLLTTSVSFSGLSAKDGQGNTYTLNVSYTPSNAMTLNGVSYQASTVNTSVAVNGVASTAERFPSFFLFSPAPTRIGALIVAGRNSGFAPITYTIYTLASAAGLPTSAQVGASGTYATAVSYGPQMSSTSTAGAAPTGNLPVTWSLDADSASTALLCFTLPGEKDCYRINAAGDIVGTKLTVQVGTQSLTFQ